VIRVSSNSSIVAVEQSSQFGVDQHQRCLDNFEHGNFRPIKTVKKRTPQQPLDANVPHQT
jgi:hypothetical protein